MIEITSSQLVALVVTALLLMVEHWFPLFVRWNPHRVIAYTAGVATVGVPLTIYWHASGAMRPADYWIHFGVGGLSVLFAYLIDRAVAADNHEETLEETLHERKTG